MLDVLESSDPDLNRGLGHLARISAFAQRLISAGEAGGLEGDGVTSTSSVRCVWPWLCSAAPPMSTKATSAC
jgi:hypothetical protein